MKNKIIYIVNLIVIALYFSCNESDENINSCGFQNLNITENAKYPLAPIISTTAVWNWKQSNDTLKIQTPDRFDYYSIYYQTYYFKIKGNCISPLFCKRYEIYDTLEQNIIFADVDITIQEYQPNSKLLFRINGFSNFVFNGQAVSYYPFFKSPNGNQDVWVMLDAHYTDPVYSGYQEMFD